MCRKTICIAVIMSISILKTSADEVEGGHYIIFPVRTDLQHVMGGRPATKAKDIEKIKAHVLLDGASVVDADGLIDAKILDLASIRTDLKPWQDRKEGTLRIQAIYASTTHREAHDLLSLALTGFGPRAGFRRARVYSNYRGGRYEWREFLTRIEVAGNDAGRGESAVGDETVQVFPVRTRFSRYLASNADCVANISVVLDAEAKQDYEKIRASLKKHLPQVEIDNIDGALTLLLRLEYKEGAQPFMDWLDDEGSGMLAQELGFKQVNVSRQRR